MEVVIVLGVVAVFAYIIIKKKKKTRGRNYGMPDEGGRDGRGGNRRR